MGKCRKIAYNEKLAILGDGFVLLVLFFGVGFILIHELVPCACIAGLVARVVEMMRMKGCVCCCFHLEGDSGAVHHTRVWYEHKHEHKQEAP